MTTQFRHIDTRKPDGFYIQWHMRLEDDDCADRPDERQDGFWPSINPKDAGYIGTRDPDQLAAAQAAAQAIMDGWKRGDWRYVGVIAEARCLLVLNGVGTFYELQSPGCWGVESNAGDYLQEVFAEEKAELLRHIAAMRDPIQEDRA